MNEISEQTSSEGRDEYKTFTTPNFPALMEEVGIHLQSGWDYADGTQPHFDLIQYEVSLVRNARTIARAKERLQSAIDGRPVWDTDKRKESMAKARETLAKQRAEKKAQGGKDES